jgi:hypothetical protein
MSRALTVVTPRRINPFGEEMKRFVIGAVTLVALSSNVYAQDGASGTMTVTGTIVSSISLSIESGAGTFTGGGTTAATSTLGDISKHGAVPAGTGRANSDTAMSLWASLNVKVSKANSASASYTLSALLSSALPTGTTWALGPGYLSDVTPDVLTSAGTYGATAAYLWAIFIEDTVASGTSIANAINFTAVSN